VLAELVNHGSGLLVLLVGELLFNDLCFQVLFVFKYHSVDATLLEYHLVQSEGARFICEYKFDLAHLFNEVGVSADCETELFIVNCYISSDNE
jgi:hypothetical protein